jgi:hypothetical protein
VGYLDAEGYADDGVVRGGVIDSSGREELYEFTLFELIPCFMLTDAEIKGCEAEAEDAMDTGIGAALYGCEREVTG